ncbi:hypothetical protein QJS10_CPB18g01946 [Acorus calamus]|uniref:Uncharacterized protein n=1 Tax=Acorus calamus TaxID=4465 RepID=A0AAV9CLJ6_ACOCL|nr:hypothetical protein QJS10_CPB18g01954 [Acorus calamus]KAK1291034.1 hypothetical protein QJS10_CPB18g01946 [Acorus calamus]
MTMRCLYSNESLKVNEVVRSSESLTAKECSMGACSSRSGSGEQRPDNGNIEEAESSLPVGGCLNYEEARALLGRLEYQRGNVESALRVFSGIDIAAVAPKMKASIARRAEHRKFRSRSTAAAPPMSMHAVSLLLEAIFLKSKSLQDLGRFREAAQSCNIILDTVESALPGGVGQNFGSDCKLQEILNKAVELLPELWKLAGYFHEALLSYRRALLNHFNLDADTTARIQKEFAIFLLYGGCDASPPNLRSQMDGSFIPRNNIEEALLLLMILLRNSALDVIEWDPSVLDHLTFALSMSGELKALANQVEEMLPGVIERKERYYTLALCYLGEGDDLVALNLLRKLLSAIGDPNCVKALLLASKICGENNDHAAGISFARRALDCVHGECDQLGAVAHCLLGINLSAQAQMSTTDSEHSSRQSEALAAFEKSEKLMRKDTRLLFNLSLEYAEQRKLDAALSHAKQLINQEGGCNIRSWLLVVRILSAQKRYMDAQTIINAALDQTGKWSQGDLLRTKAKIQIAQGQVKNAIETYTNLLALLQVKNKSSGLGMKLLKSVKDDRSMEIETWHDLANVYISMSQWRDAEVCLSKSKAISPNSASLWHATGRLYEAKGLHKEAHKAFSTALGIDPTHMPSLISTAEVLRQLGMKSSPLVRSLLADALKVDRGNHSAWYNLGLFYMDEEGGKSMVEAAECFQAAHLLEESAPIEPFR